MKLKEDVKEEDYYTGDWGYDIFDGGYFEPTTFYETEDAKKIQDAINLLRRVQHQLEEEGYKVEC